MWFLFDQVSGELIEVLVNIVFLVCFWSSVKSFGALQLSQNQILNNKRYNRYNKVLMVNEIFQLNERFWISSLFCFPIINLIVNNFTCSKWLKTHF